MSARVIRVKMTTRPSLPVFPYKHKSAAPVGMSQRCHSDIHSMRGYFLRLYFPTALTIWDQMRLHFSPAFLVYLFRDGLRRSAVYFALIPLTALTIMV
jgi:hypothetical protein